MAHELNASINVILPDDPKSLAMDIAKITNAWSAMISSLDTQNVQSSLSINETRAKPTPKPPGERRPRRTAEQIAADKAAALNVAAPERESVG